MAHASAHSTTQPVAQGEDQGRGELVLPQGQGRGEPQGLVHRVRRDPPNRRRAGSVAERVAADALCQVRAA